MKRTTYLFGLLMLLFGSAPDTAAAQGQTVVAGAGFVPGGRELFTLDFGQQPPGAIPKGLKYLRGPLEVIEKDGLRMLRSAGHSEFLITLPEVLPANFNRSMVL